MTILIDTGFLLALHNEKDPHHARARELSRQVMKGEHGRPILSDYIVAEVLNYAVSRSWPTEATRRLKREILGEVEEPWVDLMMIDHEVFETARTVFDTIGLEKGLSFTDCSTVALAKAMRTRLVASFDSGFDGLLDRVS